MAKRLGTDFAIHAFDDENSTFKNKKTMICKPNVENEIILCTSIIYLIFLFQKYTQQCEFKRFQNCDLESTLTTDNTVNSVWGTTDISRTGYVYGARLVTDNLPFTYILKI